jgi:hypothetical protein
VDEKIFVCKYFLDPDTTYVQYTTTANVTTILRILHQCRAAHPPPTAAPPTRIALYYMRYYGKDEFCEMITYILSFVQVLNGLKWA